jgi:lysophospholipase L1-like esterase
MAAMGSLRRCGVEIAATFAVVLAFGGCGSKVTPNDGSDTDTTTPSTKKPTSSSGSSSGSKSGSGSGSGTTYVGGDDSSQGTSSSGSISPSGDDGSAGDDGSTGTSSGASGDDGSTGTSSGGSGDDGGPVVTDAPATPSCVKGQVPPNKVVMIGDSYLDPAYSNAALDLFSDAQNAGSLAANTTYRHYYQGGAAMNYGSLQFNIPYQYENEAKTDGTVTNPTDIDTIIMDGGGNDVLIDNQGCLTTPPPGNTSCATAITGTVNRAQQLLQEMASNGVKHIVYFFYPHLDPAGGGILPTPAPGVNTTLDYAYPLAEQICCGSSFTSTTTSYTCSGNTSGAQCIFVDTRPAFEGHTADYIKSTDHVHPTPAGAQVIADLVWKAMTDYCIAQ